MTDSNEAMNDYGYNTVCMTKENMKSGYNGNFTLLPPGPYKMGRFHTELTAENWALFPNELNKTNKDLTNAWTCAIR
jgi:hypothetical protein